MCDGQRVTSNSPAHSCACSGRHGNEVGRVVEAGTDLVLPAVTFPSRRVLEVAGESKLRHLVRRQHELLAAGPLAAMFPADASAFAALVDKVEDFFVEACGGDASYTQQHGKTCMRTRHFPFSVDEAAREIWLAALFAAMTETGFPEEVREEYWTWLEAMSVRMINRRTMKAQPVRMPYLAAQLRFGGRATEAAACGVPTCG
jgi:hemoglobin